MLLLILTGKEIKVFPHRNYVTCVQFHPSDPTLFLAGTFKSSILCLMGQEDWKCKCTIIGLMS